MANAHHDAASTTSGAVEKTVLFGTEQRRYDHVPAGFIEPSTCTTILSRKPFRNNVCCVSRARAPRGRLRDGWSSSATPRYPRRGPR